MKKLNSILFVLLLLVITSCDNHCIDGVGPTETRELNLSDITSFSFNGSGNVYVMKGVEQEIIVEGQANILDRLEKNVRAGHWDIEFDGCVKNMRELNVYITVPELEAITLNGSGSIQGFVEEESFQELVVILSGSGEIDLEVYVESLYANISGSGQIHVRGESDEAQVNITGSGTYKGFMMDTDIADVDIAGSGDAELSVSDDLDVSIQGSGNVYYKGDPTVNSNITGSGQVIKS